jgi:putative endonuclease
MHYVYILRSLKDGKQYIGNTDNLERRLDEHNRGSSKATKNRRPLKIIYKEEFSNKTEAIKRERQLKKYKSSSFINKIIDNAKISRILLGGT